MARLIIEAIAEDGIAAPGNVNVSAIIVSVTNSKGEGVIGLNKSNFTLGSIMVGPGGSLSHIDSVMHDVSAPITGIYIIRIAPLAGQTWKLGVYIWSLKVTSGVNIGQTLCSTSMD